MLAMEGKAPKSEQDGTNSNPKTNQVRVKAGQELQGIQNSNGEPNQEWLKNSTAGSASSATRTRTMCYGHNEDSEDYVSTKQRQTHLVTALNEKAVVTQGSEEALCKEGGQNVKGITFQVLSDPHQDLKFQ